MSLYNVIAPCIVMQEDTAVHYTEPAEAVEIDDAVAASLLEEGVLERHGEPDAAPPVETAPPANSTPSGGSTPQGSEQADPPADETPPVDPAPKRRGRGAES